ncbi:hypothetical protein [Parapedobacter tibetensis]|nr:hypothetical protein [Parapedobacter tibetensis]
MDKKYRNKYRIASARAQWWEVSDFTATLEQTKNKGKLQFQYLTNDTVGM